jgi:hypothetical protein
MVLPQPRDDIIAMRNSEVAHFLCVVFGNEPSTVVLGGVPLPSEPLQRLDSRGVPADRQTERFFCSMMVIAPGRSIPYARATPAACNAAL